jgi:TolA-binding protein
MQNPNGSSMNSMSNMEDNNSTMIDNRLRKMEIEIVQLKTFIQFFLMQQSKAKPQTEWYNSPFIKALPSVLSLATLFFKNRD